MLKILFGVILLFALNLWALTLFALLGLYVFWVTSLIIIVDIITLSLLVIHYKRLFVYNRKSIIYISVFFGFTALAFLFHHYSVDGGRDNGVYFSTAVNISKTGRLYLYDRHTLTFPGFSLVEDKIIPHSSPAYVSWLALFYNILKDKGIFLADSIIFLIFLFILFFIAEKIFNLPGNLSLIVVLFYSTNYLAIWISRRSLNENLFNLLLYSSMLFFILGLKLKKIRLSFLALLLISISILVRKEALVILFPLVTLFLIIHINLFFKDKKMLLITPILLVLFVFPFLYYVKFIDNSSFEQVFALVHNILIQTNHSPLSTGKVSADTIPLFGKYLPIFSARRFMDYFFFLLIIFFFVSIECLIYIKNHKRENVKVFLIILLYLLPFFFVFINAMNATDLPYFMRRFYVFYPILLLLGLKYIFTHLARVRYYILVLLMFSNLIISSSMLGFIEYDQVPEQIKKLDSIFPKKSTILILDGKARDYTTNPYGFLYNISIWATYWHFTFDKDIVVSQINGWLDNSSPVVLENNLTNNFYLVSSYPLDVGAFKLSNYIDQNSNRLLFSRGLFYKDKFTITTNQLQPSSLIRYYVDRPGWRYSEVENMIGDPFPRTVRSIHFDYYIYEFKKI